MKVCPKCGKENSSNSRYCSACGEVLTGEINSGTSSVKVIISIAGAMVLLLIIGCTFLFRGSTDSKKQEVSVETEAWNETKDDVTIAENESLAESTIDLTDKSVLPNNVNIPNGALTYDGHSYYIFDNNNTSWEEARKYCRSRGGYMAVINNSGEDDFLYEYMLNSGHKQVFFGFSDADSEGNWEWVWEGTQSGDSRYLNWGTNDEGEKEPNSDSRKENYAQLDTNMITGRWNDSSFGYNTRAYICEWDYVK